MKKIIFAICAYFVFFGPANSGTMRFIFLIFITALLISHELITRYEVRKMDGKFSYWVLEKIEIDNGSASVLLAEDSGSRKFEKVFTAWPPEGFREVISMGRVLLIPSRRV